MKNKNKILFFICLGVFLCAVGFGLYYWFSIQQREQAYKTLAEESRITATPTPTEVPAASPTPTEITETPVPIEIPIDFTSLQQQNPDIYGWIQIPDTVIDYPILQSGTDDSYYLDHTVEGVQGYPGSIYTESLNSKDFSDKNTVIYGHNMKDGSMFGGLRKYVDGDYMKDHSEIIVYTPEHKLTYQVFAAVTYDDKHILNTYDFSDPVQYQAYLDSIDNVRNMASYRDPDTTVTPENRIITLSTCNSNDTQRFLVEAVLISEE